MLIYGSSSTPFHPHAPWTPVPTFIDGDALSVDEHCVWEKPPRPSLNQVHYGDQQIDPRTYRTIQCRVIGPAVIHEIDSSRAGELCTTTGVVLLAWPCGGTLRPGLTVPAGESYGVSCFADIIYEVFDMPTLQFGKHAGKDIANVPEDYLVWLKNQAEDRIKEVQTELNRRAALAQPASPLIDQLVAAGYRALAKTAHPDAGGTPADFAALQAARTQLDAVCAEIHAANGGTRKRKGA